MSYSKDEATDLLDGGIRLEEAEQFSPLERLEFVALGGGCNLYRKDPVAELGHS